MDEGEPYNHLKEEIINNLNIVFTCSNNKEQKVFSRSRGEIITT